MELVGSVVCRQKLVHFNCPWQGGGSGASDLQVLNVLHVLSFLFSSFVLAFSLSLPASLQVPLSLSLYICRQ